MWACRPTVFDGGAAKIAGLLGRLLAAPTAHVRRPCGKKYLFPIPYYLLPHIKNRLAKKQVGFFMLALPIFPCSHPQSIVGEGELNFCVRDGNRWTLTPINTNYVETNSISLASTQASKLSHSIVSPLKITNASLVCDFVFQDVP